MNLHRVTYTVETESGEQQRRKFAASGAEASKVATALKKELGVSLVGKPERDEVDVPTNKAGLIAFLNSGEA